MASDRFGEIRINPEADETPSGNLDGEVRDRTSKNDSFSKKARVSRSVSSGSRRIKKKTSSPKRFSFPAGWLLLCFAVPLFLALLYGVGSYFLVPALVKGPLSKNLAANLGRPVSVSRVIYSPFSLEIFLKDVSVGPVYGDLNKKNLFDFSDISCQVDFASLFNRKLVCHKVRLEGFTANLVRLRLGSLSIDDATNFFSLIRGRSGQNVWPDWLVFDGIQLTHGKIILNDSLTNKQHRIENLSFYLPSSGEAQGNPSAMPSLNAVVNSSPVQMKGTRKKNLQGVMETRFTLKFSEIVLKNYLEYIPSLPQNPFRLLEGQADLEIELVIPELTSEKNKVAVQLNAAIKALQFSDGNGRTILKIPESSLLVNAFPARNSYSFKKIEFNRPVLTVRLDAQKEGNLQGVNPDGLGTFFMGLDQYPYGLRIENFFINEGVVEVFRGKEKVPHYTFENAQVRLNGFLNKVAREEEKEQPTPALFWISSREKDNPGVQLKFDGKYNAAEKISGLFSFSNLDMKKYTPLLPVNPGFSEGTVDISGQYNYNASPDLKDKAIGKRQWQVTGGKFAIRDFTLQRDGKKVLEGSGADCRNFSADIATGISSCENLALSKVVIDGDALPLSVLEGEKKDRKGWIFTTQNLDVQSSELKMHVENPFEQDESILFRLKNVLLRATDLISQNGNQSAMKMSASLGPKGKLLFDGTGSPEKGRIRVALQDIPLQEVKAFVSTWLALPVKNGIVDANGIYRAGEKQFSGNVRIRDFHSGDTEGPLLAWDDASTEDLQLTFDPPTLKSREISIRKPRILFGITHPEKPLQFFLQPAFEKKLNATVDIDALQFADGFFVLPEPVVTIGFQPELSGLNGSVTSVGRKLMDFSIQGRMADQGVFSIQGKTGSDNIKQYLLKVSNVPLNPFISAFSANIGVDVAKAMGAWQEDMQKTDSGIELNDRIELQNIVPDPESRYFKIISLYTDENNTIVYEGQSDFSPPDKQIFLFDRLFRGIQQDGVRAELSEQLVLHKMLPGLVLQDRISFVPGTTTLVVNKDLADYEKLLSKRPYLRLGLIGNYDPVKDRQIIKKHLQDAVDAEREAENKRRAAERQKILEQEKARLEELKKDQTGVVEEKIPPVELGRDLQPLPRREVEVKEATLVELALNRAAALFRFFNEGLLIASERIHQTSQTGDTGAEVRVEVLPYAKGVTTKRELGSNDKTAN